MRSRHNQSPVQSGRVLPSLNVNVVDLKVLLRACLQQWALKDGCVRECEEYFRAMCAK